MLATWAALEEAPTLLDGTVVLPGSAVPSMLYQCSRGAPEAGEATWQPGADDVRDFETALAPALQDNSRKIPVRVAANGWLGQYVGIVRGGRRFIYGNFFPSDHAGSSVFPDRWRSEPVVVCDGGPAFFGVEYDVDARRITRVDSNGGF
jgi:hypothetical protein